VGAHSNDGITSDAWRSSVVSVPPVSRTNKATNQKQIPALVTLCTLGRHSGYQPKALAFLPVPYIETFVGAQRRCIYRTCALSRCLHAHKSHTSQRLSLGQRDK